MTYRAVKLKPLSPVFWPAEDQTFDATITYVIHEHGMYSVHYDDGSGDFDYLIAEAQSN